MLEAALQRAANGKHVLPLGDGGSKFAKIPRTPHGLHDATTDEQQIRAWWNAWPNANIGIRTGEASGIVVLDVDDENAFEEFERRHHPLPETLTVKTGRGGRHLIFEAPNHGTHIGNRAGFAGLPGLDIRGDNGYIVAPPSVHENGTAYTFANYMKPVPPPAWFVELAEKKEPPRPPSPPKPAPTGGTPYGRKALEAEAAEVARTPQGARNDALNRAAFSVGQLVAGGEIGHHDAVEGLVVAGLTAGLPEA